MTDIINLFSMHVDPISNSEKKTGRSYLAINMATHRTLGWSPLNILNYPNNILCLVMVARLGL